MNTSARQYVNDYSGFFHSTAMPTHDDVDEYFTPAEFQRMFGDSTLPDGLEWDDLRRAAHAMIDERASS